MAQDTYRRGLRGSTVAEEITGVGHVPTRVDVDMHMQIGSELPISGQRPAECHALHSGPAHPTTNTWTRTARDCASCVVHRAQGRYTGPTSENFCFPFELLVRTFEHNYELAWVTSGVHGRDCPSQVSMTRKNSQNRDVSLLWKCSRLTCYADGSG